jgi:hypothetical protein
VRWRSIVGASALVLAICGSTVSPASAQTPVGPTTVAGSADDKPKDDPTAAEEQPKPDKPTAETPAAETPAQPSGDAAMPKPEKPKALEPKPTTGDAKPDKPKPADPKLKPDKPKPTTGDAKPDKPKPADPKLKPDKPKPTTGDAKPDKPKPIAGDRSAPLHVHDGPATAQAPSPGTATQAAPASGISPSNRAAHSVAGAHARHVSISPAPRAQRTTALHNGRAASDAPPPDPASPGAEGDADDAAPVTGDRVGSATAHAARVGPDDAAEAAAPGDRRQSRALPLDAGPRGYDLTLLLAIAFMTGVAFLIGRASRRQPHVGAPR